MNSTSEAKNDRINLRLKHSVKLMLERAASFEGKTVSDFILTSALTRAEETIHDHEVMRLNARDSEVFLNALAAPPQFNKKLTEAFEEHDQRVTSK